MCISYIINEEKMLTRIQVLLTRKDVVENNAHNSDKEIICGSNYLTKKI